MNKILRKLMGLILMLTLVIPLSAQTYGVRYVDGVDGNFENDGSSWAQAKNNLQLAIDELREAIAAGTITKGLVFVTGAEGDGVTYVPTSRSTSEADASLFNTSFCIYGGISVYGGFKGDEVPDDPDHPELLPKKRIMTNDETYAEVESDINADRIGETVRRWNFKYKTVLSGNHSTTPYSFAYDSYRGIYNTSYPLSSYHVVWFGTNGKIEPNPAGSEKGLTGHYKALADQALIDGCTIEGGYASSTNLIGHDHTGYGGGVYMVRNSMLRNCTIHHCSAMQRGGAVYMDGGGEVERCYIHTSQATGYGMQQGYGGGVCIDYDGALKHSYVIQCAARIGAGLAICHVPNEYPSATMSSLLVGAAKTEFDAIDSYTPFCHASVISNNTSNAEGAGVYLDEGGTLNHCSVVNNKCIGPDVIYYGRRHGRTGGIYIRNGGTIYNSVAWGNETAVNNDVQFAAYKTGDKKIYVFHSAFSKGDITDWAAVTKEDVYTLNDQNYPSPEYNSGYFPMFKQPTLSAGIQYGANGAVDPTQTADGQAYQRVYNWHPLAVSDLRMKAVQVTDAVQGISNEIRHAHTDVDVVGRHFESVSSCGALAHSYRNIQYVLLPSMENTEGRDPSETGNIPTIFVDPTLVTAGGTNDGEHTGFLDDQVMGRDWTHPLNNLPDAIYYFKQRLVDGKNSYDDDPSLTYYRLERLDGSGNVVKDGSGNVVYDTYRHVQILVKEGNVSISGQGSYVQNSGRTCAIRPGSNMRLYGGFPSTNTGNSQANRSPFDYNSDLSADVLRSDYRNHSVHVVAIANQHDVIIDGFRLYSGNANYAPEPDPLAPAGSWDMYMSLADGAGIVVNNAMSAADKRRDMTGNILRNSVIANCSAPEGAAVYVSGGYDHGSAGRLCKAELTMVNVLVRNCTAGTLFDEDGVYQPDMYVAKEGETPEEMKITLQGIVTANGNGKIWVRNCDVMNNCGFPFKCDETDETTGLIEVYNTVVFSNGLRIHSDRSNITNTVYCPKESWGHVTGQYIYMGYDVLFSDEIVSTLEANHIYRVLTHNKSEDKTVKHWRLDDGSQQGVWGTTPETEVLVRYPTFVNPSRNVGHSTGDDQSFYGGRVNYEPMPTNPIVNAANPVTVNGSGILADNNSSSIAYDFSLHGRDYGGDPDVGFIETHRLPKGGAVLYVTPDGAGKRDGSSWANAIAGNTVYVLDGVEGPALASGDYVDTEPTCDRILDSEGNPVLTTDEKYCGGFGRSWFTAWKTGATSTTTVTQAWTTERNVYDDGARAGEEEVIDDGTIPRETTNTVSVGGTTKTGFTAGYHYDPRYPYGEISGGSRSFWRANPYHSGADWNNAADYTKDDLALFINDCNTNGWINNSRQERYVGGLQYAVEKAAAYNALAPGDPGRLDGVDSVQVWVSNGKFTDYKGFIMRDNTTVIGSFPAKDGGTPSLLDRQALMSAVVDIPKSLPAQDLDAADYETILQISDEDPKAGNEALNPDAVKFWDDDYSVVENTNTQTYEYKNRSITHHYTIETDHQKEVTPDYLSNYTFTTNVSPTSEGTVGGIKYYRFGTAPSGKDCWHMTYPDKTNFVVNVEDSNNSKNKSRTLYDPSTNTSLGTSYLGNWIFLDNGSLTGLNLWQTIDNLPAGDYSLSVEMAGGYRNKFSSTDPTNIYFHIIGSDDNDCITPIMLKTIGSTTGSDDRDGNRGMAYHYVVEFTQPSDGNLKIMIEVEDGVRNTKSANATYGTADGGDPDPIPTLYSDSYGGKNPNRREFWISNVKLYEIIRGSNYYETSTDDVTTDRVVADPEPDVVTSQTIYTLQTHRTTLRKRVLTMPDVCVPTYGAGSVGDPTSAANRGKFADNLSHTHRVFGSSKAKRTSWESASYVKEDPNYVEYSDASWDGFTIRHGFLSDEAMAHGGGAGVNIYEGAHLHNCIVINNMSYCSRVKGAGMFCDGATSTIEGCFVLNNTSTHGTTTVQDQIFAGGMFMYEGTCFNSLFAKNYSYGSAGGLGFCVGRFYNNTIAYNTCTLKEDGQYSGGAISLATSSSPNLFVANTIIYGNNGIAIRDRNTGYGNVNPFLHCYVQSAVAHPHDATNRNVGNWPTEINGKKCYGIGNVYLNGVAPSAENTPFAADIEGGVYNSANPGSKANNDFRLLSSNPYCVNKGTEDFEGLFYTALRNKGKTDVQIRASSVYQSVEGTELPDNDVAFADRVQDCQVDMGAYEYDGTRDIEPKLFPNETPKKAVFYVTQTGEGMATAEDPINAACYLKFQKVLDAAGRWRYASYKYADDEDKTQAQNNITPEVFRRELVTAGLAANVNDAAITAELPNLKDYEVIIRLEGENGSGFSYIPTRSTNLISEENSNELEKSLIVPHGIRIEGGFEADFSKERDILGRPTRFSGEVYNETLGTRGNVYHVVTFTNTLFDIDEKPFKDESNNDLTGQLTFLGELPADYESLTASEKEAAKAEVENNRTVLDGLFIVNGNANGTNEEHRIGGAAVVTYYAHIRNCVVQNNTASNYGGGLYLEPLALVSGCIVKNNSALQGGGIYVYEPDLGVDGSGAPIPTSSATFVHVMTSTVVDNTATMNAGGLWFQTNLRANSSAFWRNSASNNGNVAGVFATGLTQVVENYPMNYCGVGSDRVAGVNNIELPSVASEGVRWNPAMPYESISSKGENYFPITISSVLGRAGMTYPAYERFRELYPTLELTDIFGLNRMEQESEATMTLADDSEYTKEQKNNAFIEIGARAMNGNFEVKLEYTHVMTRLFVSTTERLPTEKALNLQNNTLEKEKTARGINAAAWTAMSDAEKKAVEDDVEMYRQMGSSFLNPFHRIGDALDYIVKVRSARDVDYQDADGNPLPKPGGGGNMSVADFYKDVRFEVFACGGTFYPFRDAHGQQGEARSNTFLVPEEVTLIGGVNHEESGHAYCQETTGTKTVGGYDLNPATTYEIRMDRDRMDRNGNHVKEPWEMREQTILDGNAVSDDSRTNVYHVVTCVPDATQVGDLPTRFAEGESISSTSLSAWPLLGLNPTQGELLNNIEQECRESRDKRTIVLDGLTIMGGYANEIDEDDEEDTFQKLTYFRGGGILVEGNWNNAEATEIDLPEVLGVAKRNIPLLMTSCLLKDNTAANGGGVYTNGTFYSFSCHFTKNLATGPMTTADQTYIPWSAGGAIAGNYEIHLWNSLFDNNEARRGNYPITNTTITNADARQGYGGAVSCSETGLARICNSDFVRNKAVAYPALYNFLDNNLRSASSMVPEANRLTSPSYYGVGWHFAVNTIFWGNNATADELAEATEIVQEYYDDLYGAGNWTDLRKPYHVANFAPKLDVATLTFCSLEQGTGREGTVWYSNHDRAKEAAIVPKDYGDGHGLIDGLTRLYQGRFTDVLDDYFGYYPDGSSSTPFYKLDGSGNPIPCAMDDEDILLEGAVPTTEQKNSAVAYNYNLVLEKDNQVPGGPYFVQPSLSAGVDGYMETADWLVARLNNSVDTGWGYLKQSVEQEDESSSLFNTTFLDNSLEKATPATDQYDDLYGEGFYNLHSKNIHSRFEDIGYPNLLPIGDEPYMEYSRDGAGDGENMRRISTHPKMGVQDVFIDMGIYEYQYVQLVTAGDEIDVIWVSPTQNEGVVCDGSTAYKATSDLQLAIETLLLSRNDHDKVIKFKTGTYSPNKVTQNNMKAFYVNVPTKQDGVMLPKTLAGDETHTARSLTFKGGYPNDLMDFPLKDYEDQRDIVANPVTLLMTKEIGNEAHQLEHLFIVEDSELKGTFANYMQGKNPDFIESTMPIVFDGLTFCNPYGSNHTVGGSALYYGAQYQTKLNEGTQTYYKDHDHLLKPQSFVLDEVEHNMPKLIIKECAFVASGIEDGVSAVKIEKGGGHSLIVNSLFHSNSGAPLDAVNTMVINCTFALNGGHVTLKDDPEVYYDDPTPYHYPPALHNCIIWKDDENQTDPSLKKQWDDTDLNLSDGSMRYNAYTYWNTGTEAFDEPIGTTEEDAQHNMLLSTDNEDVLLGPNFINPTGVDPGVGTAEERLLAQKLSRDFRLNPSAHILNKASETVYKNFVPYYAETSTTEEKTKDEITYYFHSIQHSTPVVLTDAQLKGTNADKDYDGYTEFELYNVPRWNGVAIDRGAYECTAILQRVLYVMDGPVGRKDGTTWEHAYAIDHLQRAIDVASIYSLTSSNTPAERERAYVFVRAADYTGEALKLRDGVSVYGGVTDIMSSVEKEGDVFTDENIAKYINKVKAERNGTAAEDAPHNTVRGLVSPNNSVHASGFLLDGFWIQGSSDPIDMSKDNTVLVNDVITGNTVAESGQPVVNLAGGSTTGSLLYNSLVYGNTAGSGAPVVSVGAKGYVLNCTVVAPYNTAISGTMANVGNTIARDNTETGPMFAPYLGYTNAYNASLPASLKDWKPYWYQLHEFSNQINTGTDDNGAGVGSTVRDGGNSIAKLFSDYVDFSHDRDVLGNPRRLRGRVDNGCFETWRIEENAKVKATNVTNATFTTNYGGHQYPHAGSVVYLLKNASLIFAVDGEQNPLFTTAISPGYVLLKEGASIYGQGNRLSFPYVAAEKFIGARYSLMAFPFDVNVEGTVEVTGTATLTQTDKSGDITPYVYDAARRSAYNYEFQEDNSSLWKTDLTPVLNAASQISRTEGWLLDFGDNTPSDTLRFTGWNAAPAVVYAEDGSATKSVTLTQHDAHVTTATGYPRFTKAEDMGWNLKGLPWLVSNYRTGGTNPDFKMNVPHVFYSMQGNGKYAKMPGCLWSAQSWDPGASLSVGNGFFTQTAVIESTEDLTFKIPLFSGDTEAPSRERLSIDFEDEDGRGDCVTIVGYDEAGMMPYRINSDAIKWMPFQKSAPQMWITNSDGTPFSLLSHAPIETPLPVGLIVPGEMRYSFSLRDKSAVPEGISAVWLIDKQAGRVVNLMEKAYTPNHLAPQTSDHKTRFYIQLGGRPQLDMLPSAHTLRVYVHDRILHIEGTNEGDPIAVYTTTGALQVTGQAAGSHWQTPVQRGVFIVRVQGETYKVAAK